jgi:anti-sigma B factor antagonist
MRWLTSQAVKVVAARDELVPDMSTSESIHAAWDEPGGFQLTEEPLEPSGVLLVASGELDIATAPELRERLMSAIGAGAKRVVADLRPVTFMDSVALAAILHARKEIGEDGRFAIVLARDSYPWLVFEIAGLPQCLDLFETRDEAIAHVAR